MSAAPELTGNEDFEGTGLEATFASSIRQTPASQKEASQADETHPTPMPGMSAKSAEEAREVDLMFKSDEQAQDHAKSTVKATNTHALIAFGHNWKMSSMSSPAEMPTGDIVVILLFGMAVAGMLSGMLLTFVETWRKRSAYQPDISLINDQNQLASREMELEAALFTNFMVLAGALQPKRPQYR